MELLWSIVEGTAGTITDLIPIAVLFTVFQYGVLRRPLPRLGRILVGLVYVVIGLTMFRVGLYASLIPIGETMAGQLVTGAAADPDAGWRAFTPIVVFAALIGFTATLIEPTLIAVAERLRELSGGTVRPWTLRIVIALGVAVGLLAGTVRILIGMPLEYLLAGAIGLTIVLALTAPKIIVPLALDSGGLATSVVTVPLIAAYGIALAEAIPGRSTLTDGFGLIVLALLGPAIMLLLFAHGYRVYQNWLRRGENRAV